METCYCADGISQPAFWAEKNQSLVLMFFIVYSSMLPIIAEQRIGKYVHLDCDKDVMKSLSHIADFFIAWEDDMQSFRHS